MLIFKSDFRNTLTPIEHEGKEYIDSYELLSKLLHFKGKRPMKNMVEDRIMKLKKFNHDLIPILSRKIASPTFGILVPALTFMEAKLVLSSLRGEKVKQIVYFFLKISSGYMGGSASYQREAGENSMDNSFFPRLARADVQMPTIVSETLVKRSNYEILQDMITSMQQNLDFSAIQRENNELKDKLAETEREKNATIDELKDKLAASNAEILEIEREKHAKIGEARLQLIDAMKEGDKYKKNVKESGIRLRNATKIINRMRKLICDSVDAEDYRKEMEMLLKLIPKIKRQYQGNKWMKVDAQIKKWNLEKGQQRMVQYFSPAN